MREPAAEGALDACVEALGHPLAVDLAALLRESDGVQLAGGLSIWPAARIAQVNLDMRTAAVWSRIHLSFARLCFFADPGTGDRYGFLPRREPDFHDIYRWDHTNDGRGWAAGNLEQLIRWHADGVLS